MRIDFMTADDDSGYQLGKADWPVIPRVGETVVLDGLVTKADWGEEKGETLPSERVQHSQHFKVIDVIWRADMNGDFKTDGDPDVEVWLALPPEERVWEGAER